ncbi:MAG TPA: helix-hairpin-helix domain-containing protein [Polyangia bacterium]
MPDKIDVNAASETELCEVLEIDEALADRIVAYRAEEGGIRAIDDLADIEGVDAPLLQKMRERLIADVPVGTEPASPTAP